MGRMRIMRKWEMTYEICIQDIKKKKQSNMRRTKTLIQTLALICRYYSSQQKC